MTSGEGWPILLLLTLVLLSGGLLGPIVSNSLPDAKGSHADSSVFSEGRALSHLRYFSDHISPRPATDRETIENMFIYIRKVLQELESTAMANGWHLESKFLTTSGEYHWNNIQYIYSDLKHLLVELKPANQTTNQCQGKLLINTHVDTAVNVEGAGDDGVAVSISLECIRAILSNRPSPPKAPLLFLFNNAEELGLLGSHGFVSNYPDIVSSIGAFINLEAAGTFGPESLFQVTGGSFLVEQYSSLVPFPRGSVIAQDLFQTGLIPSYTDFQVFSQIGGLAGIDMALYRNGYFYHTPKDSYENIKEGSVQHFGENIFNLISRFDHSTLLSKSCKNEYACETTTYFDIAGIWMPMYGNPVTIAFFLILITSLLFSMHPTGEKGKWCSYMTSLLNNILVVDFIGFGSFLLPLFGSFLLQWISPMLWFRHPILSTLMYLPLCIGGIFFLVALVQWISRKRVFEFRSIWFAITSQWIALVFLGIYYHIGSSFLAIIYSLAFCISALTLRENTSPLPFAISLLFFFFPSFLCADVFYQLLETLVPISGRAGLKPFEIVIGAFHSLFSIIYLSPLLPLVLARKRVKQNLICSLLCIGFFILVVTLLFSSPTVYSSGAPKRILVEHVHDTTSSESFTLLIPADPISISRGEAHSDFCIQEDSNYHYHGSLPTIPSLKANEGNRWELTTPPYTPKGGLPRVILSENGGSIEIETPGAFTVEFVITPAANVISFAEFYAQDDDRSRVFHKTRFVDGKGEFKASFPFTSSGHIDIECFVSYQDYSDATSHIIDLLPDYYTATGTTTYKFHFSIE